MTGAKSGVSTGGILCPQCFVARAWDLGLTNVNWALIPIPKGFCPDVPLRGRVVPLYHYFTGDPPELMRQWYAAFVDTLGHWKMWSGESADFAEIPANGDGVRVSPVLRLDLEALFARLVRVVHVRNFRSDRVVVRRHGDSFRRAAPPGRLGEATPLASRALGRSVTPDDQ